jgi:quercetin dioxygenase-like cupin family protein
MSASQSEWTLARLAEERLVRYVDLVPCRNAFVDAYTPGSDRKENFTIIGPGVAEHPDQHVHIAVPHGFNIGGARQPPGCTNSQHSHKTEEVFIVHSGRWAFRWGVDADDGEAVLEAGDCISIPTNVFRGFENVGEDVGYLFAILGGDDPGRVLWAPQVFDGARDHGLVLLENGQLVDTAAGEAIPDGLAIMPRTTDEQVAAHRRMSAEEMRQCVVPAAEQHRAAGSSLQSMSTGLKEYPLIGEDDPLDGTATAPLAWRHGFQVRRIDLVAGGESAWHYRREPEVIYVHSGSLSLTFAAGTLQLNPGDVLTVPVGLDRRFSCPERTVCYIVRGGDQPAPAVMVDPTSMTA